MKNKILSISIVLLLLIILFFNNNVFATTTETDENGSLIIDGYDMTDIYSYFGRNEAFFIYKLKRDSENYYFYRNNHLGSAPIYNAIYGDSIAYFNSSFTTKTAGHHLYRFNKETSKFVYVHDYQYSEIHSVIQHSLNYIDIVYTSKGIYNTDHSSFFLSPSVLTLVGQKMELGEIMKTAGEQATLEMGQIILVVIMTTAGLMVLLVGLKKGLMVLINGFRH